MSAAPDLRIIHDTDTSVREQFDFLGIDDDEVIELQALKTAEGTQGVFVRAGDVESVLRTAPKAQGVYLIANRIQRQATTKRPLGQWMRIPKAGGTKDTEIEYRRVLPIDLDFERPTDTSTTDAQKAETLAFTKRVHALLLANGVHEASIAWVDSGNGYQLWIALDDLPNDDDVKALVKRILTAKLTSDNVKIDKGVYDAKRLLPLAGTMKCKGENSAEYPHRPVTFDSPGLTVRLTLDDLRAITDKLVPMIEMAESTPVKPRKKAGVYTTGNEGDLHDDALQRGKLHGDHDVECPGCHRHSASMASIRPSEKVPGTWVIVCKSDTCQPHRDGIFTRVDAIAGWDEISEQEAARKLAPMPTRPTTPAIHPDANVAILNTDTGNAERLALTYHDSIRYVPGWRQWLIWDGKYWVPDESGKICELAKQVTRDMITAGNSLNSDKGRDLMKWAVKCQSSGAILAMVKLAQTIQTLVAMPGDLDTDDMLLTVQNGTLDLRTGKLRPHDRSDMITKILPYSYDATATCPRWTKFLDRVLASDADLIGYVQRVVGYCLTASCRSHALFVLHGEGRNGKSTFTTTLQAMLGSYAIQASETLLLESSRGEHSTELVDLRGCRLAVCSETPKGKFFNENRVKALTGGDRITGHKMHQNNVTFEPSHKFLVCTNNRPNLRELTDAIKGRIHMIPFEVTIPAKERDLTLDEKLKAELPGILAWAVGGCLDWQRNGLQTAKRVEETTAAYFKDQDVVARFVSAECTVGEGLRGGFTDLYNAFARWSPMNTEGDCLSQKAFAGRLEDLGYALKKTNVGNVRLGLTLRPIEHVSANVY